MQKVTVVIPVFNGSELIGEAVESVFAQTHTDWELIVVDDGSTDDTEAVVRDYMSRSPKRFRLLHHPGKRNRGLFPTRLLGMQNAQGDVLAPIDHDDRWDTDYLENQLRVWNDSPGVGMCFGPVVWWHPEDPELDYIGRAPRPGVYAPGALLEEFLSSGFHSSPTTPGAALIHPRAIDGIERYAKRMARSLHEDQFLWFFITARWPVAVHSGAWMRYRVHTRQMSSSGNYLAKVRSHADFHKCASADLREVQPGHRLVTSHTLDDRARDLLRQVSFRHRARRKLVKVMSKQ